MVDNSFIENRIHPKIRLNSICPYFTMFPITFPYSVLLNAKKTDVVFDPFCGRGTTNFASRLLGLKSYGVDSNPVAQAVAQAKLVNVKREEVNKLCSDILFNFEPKHVPSSEFWEWAYHAETLINICKLRDFFLEKDQLNDVEIALRAIVLGTLHGPIMKTQASYLSNQMPRTFSTKPNYSVNYWKANQLIPNYVNLLQLVEKKTVYFFNDDLPETTDGEIILGDSRWVGNVFEDKFDWIVTSPPYFGMSTYKQDQWLRNWFLGDKDDVDYSSKQQLVHWSEKSFVISLSQVWSNAANKCNPSAKLVIRFGALPSKSKKTPQELIEESLSLSNCNWQIENIQSAGKPISSNRQANQFKNAAGSYVEEIDVFAHLN